eukprot:2963480-Pyramimonas_sp.AAC.2
MATAQGFSWVEILWDVDRFYDHVRLFQVASVAERVGHPLPALALGSSIHRSPRRLRAEGVISELICRDRSLTAGCNQSVDLAKLSLWQVLESLHAAFGPLDLSAWVDGLGRTEI